MCEGCKQDMDEWMTKQQGVSPKIQQKNKTVQRLNVVFLRLYFVPAWDSQASIKSKPAVKLWFLQTSRVGGGCWKSPGGDNEQERRWQKSWRTAEFYNSWTTVRIWRNDEHLDGRLHCRHQRLLHHHFIKYSGLARALAGEYTFMYLHHNGS